eukprot:TRINITY_DN8165_c0_g1_i2.p1 TRINITY_DN8165_c0_g1~~TRINITY_DN8165_c0_g1_i2.p1  ORF type:complete len:441 (+),score=102.47 TRINITY_DN8165_c0_g1_i2:285-1607(+)
MEYLHSLSPPIIHGSLSSHNVLVSKSYILKISDPGLIPVKQECASVSFNSSLCWTAPEVLRCTYLEEGQTQPLTMNSDMYAFGIVLFEILFREEPYPSNFNAYETARRVVFEGLRPKLPETLSPEMWMFFVDCWDGDPNIRPSFEQAMEVIWEDALKENLDPTSTANDTIANKDEPSPTSQPTSQPTSPSISHVTPAQLEDATLSVMDGPSSTPKMTVNIGGVEHPVKLKPLLPPVLGDLARQRSNPYLARATKPSQTVDRIKQAPAPVVASSAPPTLTTSPVNALSNATSSLLVNHNAASPEDRFASWLGPINLPKSRRNSTARRTSTPTVPQIFVTPDIAISSADDEDEAKQVQPRDEPIHEQSDQKAAFSTQRRRAESIAESSMHDAPTQRVSIRQERRTSLPATPSLVHAPTLLVEHPFSINSVVCVDDLVDGPGS